MNKVSLDQYDVGDYTTGASVIKLGLWMFVSALLVDSWIPGSAHRRFMLRLFGAQIGPGVVIKPHVKIKFPWRLQIDEHAWVGERAWIDNLDHVHLGSHSCLSQGTYLCCGNHNWATPTFDLITRPIVIGRGAWICANASIGPGSLVGDYAVLTLGSVLQGELNPFEIASGHPAKVVGTRPLQDEPASPALSS